MDDTEGVIDDWDRQAWALLAEGEIENAQARFTDCVQVAVLNGLTGSILADAYVGIGQCLIERQKSGQAFRFFEKALEAGPSAHLRCVAECHLASRT